jgi:AcrR family transcriptional regulator
MGKQQRSEETRKALLISGSHVFASKPFDKARIADILEPLGLTQGAFYFHFDNKHDLALEIIRSEHEAMVRLSNEVLNESADGLIGLVDLSSKLARLVRSDITVQAGLRLTSHAPEEFPEYLGNSFDIWNTTIAKFLLMAQEDGSMRQDIDRTTASSFVVATFMGVQEISAIVSGWVDFEERLRDVSTLAIRAIATEEGYERLIDRLLSTDARGQPSSL